jgi:3-hydroxymyristoyl/3-hydroxydecanoyl-(acyl carrier protein) dehydratase
MSETVVVRVDAGDPCFDGHFPGNPLVPGVVILDLVHAAISRQRGAAVRVVGIPAVKFLQPLRPGEAMHIELSPGNPGLVNFSCRVGANRIAEGSLRLAPAATGQEATGE